MATTTALTATGLTATGAAAEQTAARHTSPGQISTGPSTDTRPYVLPAARGVSVRSLLTVGDGWAGNGYRFVGIPDGIGTFRSGRDRVVYVNHELRGASISIDDKGGQTESPAAGTVRAHGERGAFVSRLVIDKRTGRVKRGRDLIQGTRYYDYRAGRYTTTGATGPAGAAPGTHGDDFSRFCSGALTSYGQLHDARTGRGTRARLYFANEESGDEGRAFAVDAAGLATQLPRLGLFSWENTLAARNRGGRTVVMGNEDGAEGQLRVYAGTKTRRGSTVERAGLTNGVLKVLDLADESVSTDAQFRAKYGKGRAVRVTLGRREVIDYRRNGAAQNAEALAKGLTLNRIEEGAFDPRNRHDYYFHTTRGGDTTASPIDPANGSRDGGGLWRLSFRDVDRLELGGTLTLLLDGSEAPYLNKPDTMDIDRHGNLLIQEDPGTNDALAGSSPTASATGASAWWPGSTGRCSGPPTRRARTGTRARCSPPTRSPAASSASAGGGSCSTPRSTPRRACPRAGGEGPSRSSSSAASSSP